jgi:hypothetical protein
MIEEEKTPKLVARDVTRIMSATLLEEEQEHQS